jgi:uncharacterized membrane protein
VKKIMLGFSKYFLRGIFTFLPFALTVVLLVSFLNWIEQISRDYLSNLAANFYFPGLGLLIGISLIYGLGVLTSLPQATKLLEFLELPFKNVPILKSVYSAVKSLADYFSPEGENADQQVVVVKLPDNEIEFIGLITRQNILDLPSAFSKNDRVAVFVPLSYMIGGITIFVPRRFVKHTDMRVEEAMRSALTAWMPGKERIIREDF